MQVKPPTKNQTFFVVYTVMLLACLTRLLVEFSWLALFLSAMWGLCAWARWGVMRSAHRSTGSSAPPVP